VRALLQLLGLTYTGFSLPPFVHEQSLPVIWLYELFDLIFLFRLKLGIKKHQKIALFIKADPNSLGLFENYQELLKKLLNIQELTLIRLHEPELQGYETEVHQGTVIGIKLLKVVGISRRVSLSELEAQYSQQLEYLEYLRTMIAHMSSSESVDRESLEKKKKELEGVKIRIDRLSLDIQKLKMRR
jgi:valyl-tRNA synthetase